MSRRLGPSLIVVLVLSNSGCSIAPKSFQDLADRAPLVRARAVGLGDREPDSVAIPALIDRLGDPDPVVRLTAHEELKRRTSQDFGFVPWAEPREREAAQARWKAWWASRKEKTVVTRSRRN
jgi:hypothetical protein